VALTGSIGPCSNLSVILSSANGSRHPPGTEAVVGETALLPEVDAGTCPVIQTPTKLATLAAIRMASAGRETSSRVDTAAVCSPSNLQTAVHPHAG
jgi:hypothetical protein